MVNLCLNSYTFCLYFIIYLYVQIRIHKAPEYGSNTDRIRIEYGSGSGSRILNTMHVLFGQVHQHPGDGGCGPGSHSYGRAGPDRSACGRSTFNTRSASVSEQHSFDFNADTDPGPRQAPF